MMKKVFCNTIIEKERKPVFDPYLYAWTNTEGHPRTLGQIYSKWKGVDNKNMPVTALNTESNNMELVFDKLIEMVITKEHTGIPSYIQVKLL